MDAQIVKKLLDSSCGDDVYLGIQYLYKLSPEEIETFWRFRNREDYKTQYKPNKYELFILYGHLIVYHGFFQNWGEWEKQKDDDFSQFSNLTPKNINYETNN